MRTSKRTLEARLVWSVQALYGLYLVAGCSGDRNSGPETFPSVTGTTGGAQDSGPGDTFSNSHSDETSGGGLGTSDGAGSSNGAGSGPNTSEEGPTSEGPVFDVAMNGGDDGNSACNPDTEKCGCSAVDILFSLDVSASQEQALEQMRTQFPSFVDVMFDRLPPNVDLHVGITTASMGHSAAHGDSLCGFQGPDIPPPDQLYMPPTTMVVPGNGTQGRLWEFAGKAFFAVNTSDPDRTPLKTWFTGAASEVADVSVNKTYGDAELGAATVAWAFHPISQTPGFIRDKGAVAVLFLTGDADHSYYVEDAKFLHDTVVAAKAACGGDKCIIGAGVLNSGCDDPAHYAAFDFLRSFGREPIWGDILKGQFGIPGPWASDPEEWKRALGEALAQVVVETCASIPPAE